MMRVREALKVHRLAAAEPLLPAALVTPANSGKRPERRSFSFTSSKGVTTRLVVWFTRVGGGTTRSGPSRSLSDSIPPIPCRSRRLSRCCDTAAQAAPDDDRIWLGWAALETRQGRFEEARGWLLRCLARRPTDPAVWRVWLDWARAAENESEVRRALAHLAPDRVPRIELLRAARLVRSPRRRHGRGAPRTGTTARVRPRGLGCDGESGGAAVPDPST